MLVTSEALRALDSDGFRTVMGLVFAERDRRAVLDAAPVELARIQSEVLTARDSVDDGDIPVFVEPSTPVELYPKGWRVRTDAGVFVSLVDNNGTVPGVSDAQWELVTEDDGGE